MTMLTEERAATEERVGCIEKQRSDRLAEARKKFRTELSKLRIGISESRTEVANLRAEVVVLWEGLRTAVANLQAGRAELRTEMQTGFAELRAEMRAGFAELRAEIAEGGDRMVRWLIAIAAVGAVVFAVATTVLIRIFG